MNSIIAVSILGGTLAVDNRSSLRLMLSQPLCGGVLAGLVTGAPSEGLFAGALLQMIFLGYISIRGERVPDLPVAGVAASALYIFADRGTGGDPSLSGVILFLSLFLAIVVSVIGRALYRFWEVKSWDLFKMAERYVMEGKIRRASVLHLSTLFVHFLYGFLMLVVAIPAGCAFIRFFIGRMGETPVGSLELLYLLLPFIGVGSLLRLHFVKARAFWFGAGFLVSYVFLLVRG